MTSNYEILSFRFFNDILDVVASDEITVDLNNVLELRLLFNLRLIVLDKVSHVTYFDFTLNNTDKIGKRK